MALKDDAHLLAMTAAILLQRHNHPLQNNIKSVVTDATALLDAIDSANDPQALEKAKKKAELEAQLAALQ